MLQSDFGIADGVEYITNYQLNSVIIVRVFLFQSGHKHLCSSLCSDDPWQLITHCKCLIKGQCKAEGLSHFTVAELQRLIQ